MNLLVVGNGFVLAHNLATRYSDFLNYGAVLQEINSKAVKNTPFNNLIEKYGEKFKSVIEKHNSLNCFYENSFFRYFLYVYSYKQSFDKEFN